MSKNNAKSRSKDEIDDDRDTLHRTGGHVRPERKRSDQDVKRKESDTGEGGGGGNTDEVKECGFCGPCGCGACRIPLRYASFALSIWFIIWCSLWVLACLSPFVGAEPHLKDQPGNYYIRIFFPILISILLLVCSAFLLVGTLKEKKLFLIVFCIGVIVAVGASLIYIIALAYWDHAELTSKDKKDVKVVYTIRPGLGVRSLLDGDGGAGLGDLREYELVKRTQFTGNIFDMDPGDGRLALGFAVWIWYPWWVVYSYYIELGGRSWCNCGCL